MIDKALMNTYGDRSATLVKGEGCWLWDSAGKRYLDGLSGIAVCGLGHSHDSISAAIAEQASKLNHCSNFFDIPSQRELAEELCMVSGMDKVFFGNSGAEANEAAIKIARLYGHNRNIKTPTVIVMDNAFHGRTLATLSASGSRKVQAGFEPLVAGFVRAPFNDTDALKKIAENNPNICAVLVEPIQGEGGIIMPAKDYLYNLRKICNQNDWLLMLDEVQTGNARTGKYFCYQHAKILPDVVTTSKGLGNGIPIGACLAGQHAAEILQPGNHGSTFGGNPLCCAGALAVLKVIREEDLMFRAGRVGKLIMQKLKHELSDVEHVLDIRGLGCMVGIQLDRPCKSLFSQALESGLIINITADCVIRLLPPLIMTDEQTDILISILSPLIKKFNRD
jgi:acetylornithine/N-succinyldiaminopimelate aminotransferase